MDHTTFFPIPAPARYLVLGSAGNVVDIQTLPRHSIGASMRCAVITFSQDVLESIGPLSLSSALIASAERRHGRHY
jgi:hypothetical protein